MARRTLSAWLWEGVHLAGLYPVVGRLHRVGVRIAAARRRRALKLEQRFDPCGSELPSQVLRLRALEDRRHG